jgi:hypothetical protein
MSFWSANWKWSTGSQLSAVGLWYDPTDNVYTITYTDVTFYFNLTYRSTFNEDFLLLTLVTSFCIATVSASEAEIWIITQY